MPSPVFWQPTELQPIPAHNLASVLSFAASDSMLRLQKGQGLDAFHRRIIDRLHRQTRQKIREIELSMEHYRQSGPLLAQSTRCRPMRDAIKMLSSARCP